MLVLQASLAGPKRQRRIAARILEEPPFPGRRRAVWGLLAAPLGLMLWFLALMATADTIRCVFAYPLTDGPDYSTSWGGPSWQGAWAVHAAIAVALFPLELWLLSALSLLSARIFAGDRRRWVLPVAGFSSTAIVLFFIAFVRQL
jgi:hypothetical protein